MDGAEGESSRALAEGGRDARQMQPIGMRKDRGPVVLFFRALRKGGMGAVVDDVRGAAVCPALHEIDADALAPADDVAGIHPVAAEGVHRRLSDGVRGKLGDKDCLIAETGKTDRSIGLSPAVDGFEAFCLHEAFVAGRGEPQHEFADGDNVHSFLLICSDVRSIFFIILPNQGKIVKEWAKVREPGRASPLP